MKRRLSVAATLAVMVTGLAAGTAYAGDTRTQARQGASSAARVVPIGADDEEECFALALWPMRTGTLTPRVSGSGGPECPDPAEMSVDVTLYQPGIGQTTRHVEATDIWRLVGTATRPCVSGVYYVGVHYRVVKQDGRVFEGDKQGPSEYVDCG